MTFTKEQIEILSAWEDNFRTAIKAKWARNPGRSALRVIWEIYTKATGDRRPFSDNCDRCIVNLLHDCGVLYYEDVEELSRKKAVSVSQEPAKPVKKARVKTRR